MKKRLTSYLFLALIFLKLKLREDIPMKIRKMTMTYSKQMVKNDFVLSNG